MDSARRYSSSSNHNNMRRSRNLHAPRRNPDEFFSTNMNALLSSKSSRSRSPSRAGRNLFLDPFAVLNSSMTAAKISASGSRSSKSSGSSSVRQSTSSHDTDTIIDSSLRLRSNVTMTLPQRSNGSRPSTPAVLASNLQKKDKGKDRQAKSHGSAEASFSGPLAAAEFERMRNEIESLKSVLSEQKKNARKQAKKIEELKTEVVTGNATRDEQKVQFQLLKSKNSRNEELLTKFETSLTCNICMELLNKPFSLSPCGHTFCLHDLQEWFRKAPPTGDDMDVDADDPDYIMYRQKSCPSCRAIVIGRPLPVYLIKDLIGALQVAKAGVVPTRRSNSPYVSGDPWEGLFPDDDEDEEDEDDEESEVGVMPFGFLYSESDSEMEMHEDNSEYDSNGEPEEEDNSGNEDEEEEEVGASGEELQEDEDCSDEDDDEHYVSPLWEPPYYPRVFPQVPQSQLVRRGCPPLLSTTYRMRYSHNNGLVAHINSLDPDDVGTPPHGSTSRMHRLFLGWNIRNVDDHLSEHGQRLFMAQILEEFRSEPHKFSVQRRANGCLDVHILVRADQVVQYYTTESESW